MTNKILSAFQMKQCDQFTVENDGISSLELMERAALQFLHAIVPFIHGKPPIHIFCGSGNNGGDGFALARLLQEKEFLVHVYFIETGSEISVNCKLNSDRFGACLKIESENDFPTVGKDDVIIDALLGTGLTRPVEGFLKQTISFLNNCGAKILSIDIPSGLPCDSMPFDDGAVKAIFTGTFESPKLNFFMNESAPFVGDWQVLSIGLNAEFLNNQLSNFHYLNAEYLADKIYVRPRFSHKGNYGHGLMIAGSEGKMGSAVLAAKAALRSGIGLLTVQSPACGVNILQTSVPEAMCISDKSNKEITDIDIDLSPYSAIGIGPGIGKGANTVEMMKLLIPHINCRFVIDADGLNILSENRDLLEILPQHTILTPHPKEFERLAGKSANSFERLDLQVKFAKKYRCIVVMKDAITTVVLPDGKVFFNTSGNPGMATGGSGDVLTGIITGLLAQGYSPEIAAILGVFYHGKAGDTAALQVGQNQIIASDLIQYFRL